MRRAKAAARSGPIRRVAKVFAKTATVRVAIARLAPRPSRDGDRPRGDRPRENSAATRNFSRGAPDRGPRKDFGDRPDERGDQSRGRSARIAASAMPRPARDGARNFDKPRFDRAARRSRRRRASAFLAFARGSSRDERPIDRQVDAIATATRPEGRTDWQEHPRSEVARRSAAPRQRGRQQDLRQASGVRRPRRLSRAQARFRQARAARRAEAEEIRRAHRQGGVARRPCLAPRRRGMDHAGPRHRQRPRHQFAGARRHRATTSSPSTASRCRRASARGCSCITSRAG